MNTNEYSFEKILALEEAKTSGYVDHDFRNDRDVVLEAVKVRGDALLYTSKEIYNDKEIVYNAVLNDYKVLEDYWYEEEYYEDWKFRNDRDLALIAVKQNRYIIRDFTNKVQDDFEVATEALKKDVRAFGYVSSRLRNDEKLVRLGLELYGSLVFHHCGNKIRNNKEFMESVINEDVSLLKYASKKLRSDKEWISKLVLMNSSALKYASCELRNNEEFMEGIISKDIFLLKYAPAKLRNNKEFLLKFLERDSSVFSHASKELRGDKEFILKALEYNPNIFKKVNMNVLRDKDFASPIISQYPNLSVWYLNKVGTNNREFYDKLLKLSLTE